MNRCAQRLPTAKLFGNDQVNVIRALEQPHVNGHFHEHRLNRVMVYLQGGTQTFKYQDGQKIETFCWKAGAGEVESGQRMHSPEVTGNEPFNIVEVELKNNGFRRALDCFFVGRRIQKLARSTGFIRLPASSGYSLSCSILCKLRKLCSPAIHCLTEC